MCGIINSRTGDDYTAGNYCGIPTFEFRTDEDPHKAININGKTITPTIDPSPPCSGDCWAGHVRSWKINM